MCLALRASGLWLRYAVLQNLIPSFPWIAPPRPPPWGNPRKGRDQILPSGNLAIICTCPLTRSEDEREAHEVAEQPEVRREALPRAEVAERQREVRLGHAVGRHRRAFRDHAHITSAKFADFLTPSPLVHICYLIFTINFTRTPLL